MCVWHRAIVLARVDAVHQNCQPYPPRRGRERDRERAVRVDPIEVTPGLQFLVRARNVKLGFEYQARQDDRAIGQLHLSF